jgi:hypothetical protein
MAPRMDRLSPALAGASMTVMSSPPGLPASVLNSLMLPL